MAFVEERGEYCEEEEEEVEKKLMMGESTSTNTRHTPFSFYPSATSLSSPSSSHYHQILTQSSGRWGGSGYAEPRQADEGEAAGARGPVVEREHMFDKVVTPSDVGKLNRLVIPKQHAEKYFPLDSSANEKGLLLTFEDRTGKTWRFRYSYWNSSQSYVMTKGWSRFVKDKKLDAGDIVSFERGVGDAGRDRLFIDWKHRPDMDPSRRLPLPSHHRSVPWSRLFFPHMPRYNHVHVQQQLNYGYGIVGPGSIYNLRPPGGPVLTGSGDGSLPMVFESVPVAHGKSAAVAKRLRLFGVNMDCPDHESDVQHQAMASTSLVHTMALSQPQLPPPLQLQLYNGSQPSSSSAGEVPRKHKPSLSLDLDI